MSDAATAVANERPKIEPERLQVRGSRLLVRHLSADKKTDGGILLPETARDTNSTTLVEVVGVGDGRVTEHGVRLEVTAAQKGDYALIGKFAGTPVGRDETFRIINDVEVLAVYPR